MFDTILSILKQHKKRGCTCVEGSNNSVCSHALSAQDLPQQLDLQFRPDSQTCARATHDLAPASAGFPCAPVVTAQDVDAAQAGYHELRSEEPTRRRSDPQYLLQQPELDARMRAVVVDWLVDVCAELHLGDDTLYLAVDLLDRFLSKETMARMELQLSGAACLWIAAKFTVECPPGSRQMVDLTADTYTAKELVSMEHRVLAALGYEIGNSTAHDFLEHLLQALHPGDVLQEVAAAEGGGVGSDELTCRDSGKPAYRPASSPAYTELACCSDGYDTDGYDSEDCEDCHSSAASLLGSPPLHPDIGFDSDAVCGNQSLRGSARPSELQLGAAKRPHVACCGMPVKAATLDGPAAAKPGGGGGSSSSSNARRRPPRVPSDLNPVMLERITSSAGCDSPGSSCCCNTELSSELAGDHVASSPPDDARTACCSLLKEDMPRGLCACGGVGSDATLHGHKMTCQLARFFCESTLLECGLMVFEPSQVAASSLLLARHLVTLGDAWGPQLQQCAGYSLQALLPCAVAVAEAHQHCLHDPELLAISYKYSATHPDAVAALISVAPAVHSP